MDLNDINEAAERLARTMENLAETIAAGMYRACNKVGEAFSGLFAALQEADHSADPDDNPVRPIEMKRKRGWKRKRWS